MSGLGEGTLQANRSLPESSYLPGIENQIGGGTYTMTSTQPSIKDYENVFGPVARNIKDDLQMHKRHGRWHLPDVLKGSNPWLADRIDGLISDANNSPFTTFILPYRYHENVDGKVKWNVWSFDEGMASRVPYESAARHLTQSKKSYAGYLTRSGLAIKMEHNFMMTPKGRENFQNNLMQLIGSIQYTNDFDVTMALITAPSYETERKSKYMDTNKNSLQICREYVDLFGFVQKNPNALDILIEESKFRMKEWNGPQPNFMLVNAKIGFIMNMTPEKTNWFAQGPDGVKRLKAGPELNSYRGLKVVNTRSFQTETGLHPRDMLRRRVRVAEYYRILPDPENVYREFELYNEGRDNWFGLVFDDLMKMSNNNQNAKTEAPREEGSTVRIGRRSKQAPDMSKQRNMEEKFNQLLKQVIKSGILERRTPTLKTQGGGPKTVGYRGKQLGMAWTSEKYTVNAVLDSFKKSWSVALSDGFQANLLDQPVFYLMSTQGNGYNWICLSNCPVNCMLFSEPDTLLKNKFIEASKTAGEYAEKYELISKQLAPYPNFFETFTGKISNVNIHGTQFLNVFSRRYAFDERNPNTKEKKPIEGQLVLQPVGGFYEPNNAWIMNELREGFNYFTKTKLNFEGGMMFSHLSEMIASCEDKALACGLFLVAGNTLIDVEMASIFIHMGGSPPSATYNSFFTSVIGEIHKVMQAKDTKQTILDIGQCSMFMKQIFKEAYEAAVNKPTTFEKTVRKRKIVTMWTNTSRENSVWMKESDFILHDDNPKFGKATTSGLFKDSGFYLPDPGSGDESEVVKACDELTDQWTKIKRGFFLSNEFKLQAAPETRHLNNLFRELFCLRIFGDFYQLRKNPVETFKASSPDETIVRPDGWGIEYTTTDFGVSEDENLEYPIQKYSERFTGKGKFSGLDGIPLCVLSTDGGTPVPIGFTSDNLLEYFAKLYISEEKVRDNEIRKMCGVTDAAADEIATRLKFNVATLFKDGDIILGMEDIPTKRSFDASLFDTDVEENVKYFLTYEGQEYLTGVESSGHDGEPPETIRLRRRASYLMGLSNVKEKEKKINELEEQISRLEAEKSAGDSEIPVLKKELNETKEKLGKAEEEVKRLLDMVETLKPKPGEDSEVARLKQSVMDKEKEIKELADEKRRLETDLIEAKEEMQKLTSKITDLTFQKAQEEMRLQDTIKELNEETTRLAVENETLKNQLQAVDVEVDTSVGALGVVVPKMNMEKLQAAATTEFLIIRPNIEHNMMGIILGMAGDQLGYTLWGQTELAVYDDSMHGLWGMSYKYHSKAIVFNFKNLIRLWDVCYDGYNGGKDDTYVDWTDDKSVRKFQEDTTDVSKNYNGASMMVFRMEHLGDLKNVIRNWPSPIVFHETRNREEGDMPFRYGIDNEHVLNVQEFRVFNKKGYYEFLEGYKELLPPFSHLHNTRKAAGESAQADETTGEALAFQGSMRIKSLKTGTIISEIQGSGHHGPDYIGAASIRAGKGVKNPSGMPSLFRPI